MSNNNIDKLTCELERLRIQREEALRVVTETDQAEAGIIRRIERVRAAERARFNNSHRPGDTVRITNALRSEYGTV